MSLAVQDSKLLVSSDGASLCTTCCNTSPPDSGQWTVEFVWSIGTCEGGVWSRTPGWEVSTVLSFHPGQSNPVGNNFSPNQDACVRNGAVTTDSVTPNIDDSPPAETPIVQPAQTLYWYAIKCTFNGVINAGLDTTCGDCYAAMNPDLTGWVVGSSDTGAAPAALENTSTCDLITDPEHTAPDYLSCGKVNYTAWVGPYCSEAEAQSAAEDAAAATTCIQ